MSDEKTINVPSNSVEVSAYLKGVQSGIRQEEDITDLRLQLHEAQAAHHVDPIPAEIVKALCLVTLHVSKVRFDSRNEHDGYDYASVDAIYEGVRKQMAEAGLGVLLLETGFNKFPGAKPGSMNAQITFQYVLVHASGASWADRHAKRTVIVRWSGPQSSQAAQSYVEKAIIKSLFKLPTGEPDVESIEVSMGAEPKKKAQAKTAAPAASKKSADEMIKELVDQKPKDGPVPPEAQDAWTEKWSAEIDTLTDADKDRVREAFKAARKP